MVIRGVPMANPNLRAARFRLTVSSAANVRCEGSETATAPTKPLERIGAAWQLIPSRYYSLSDQMGTFSARLRSRLPLLVMVWGVRSCRSWLLM